MSRRRQRDIARLGQQQQQLQGSQRTINGQLAGIIAQLQQQSDSTFDGQSWGQAGQPSFGDCLIAHGKQLVALGENFNSGKLPQWALDQQPV